MLTLIVVCIFSKFYLEAGTTLAETEEKKEGCEHIAREILSDDRSTVVDETPSRLCSTWLSQGCEARGDSAYRIRKYKFFENGSFLLLRHYYAEEWCSIATHTIVARGKIEISSRSVLVEGATEAKVRLENVRLIPHDRQIGRKLARRANKSCGVESKWRPYVPRILYERSTGLFGVSSSAENSLSIGARSAIGRPSRRCLRVLGIDFSELRLLRVERRRRSNSRGRVELLLGESWESGGRRSAKTMKPSWLQASGLVREDTITGCPVCLNVLRSSEYGPPVLHAHPLLPAFIDGLWLSSRCESVEGGFWSRRILRIGRRHGGWAARLDFYSDSGCSVRMYTVTATGDYVQLQRAAIGENSPGRVFPGDGDSCGILPGSSELRLRVAESLLTVFERRMLARCGNRTNETTSTLERGIGLTSWPRNCVPRAPKASSILSLKARLILDVEGRYNLLLASRASSDRWETPLRRCLESSEPTSSISSTSATSAWGCLLGIVPTLAVQERGRWPSFASTAASHGTSRILSMSLTLLIFLSTLFRFRCTGQVLASRTFQG